MEISVHTKLLANPNFLMREIGGEAVLVPVGEAGIFENSMLSLNKTCAFLWKQFAAPCSAQEAIDRAKEAFSGPEEEIEAGVLRFVLDYLNYNLLQEVD